MEDPGTDQSLPHAIKVYLNILELAHRPEIHWSTKQICVCLRWGQLVEALVGQQQVGRHADIQVVNGLELDVLSLRELALKASCGLHLAYILSPSRDHCRS